MPPAVYFRLNASSFLDRKQLPALDGVYGIKSEEATLRDYKPSYWFRRIFYTGVDVIPNPPYADDDDDDLIVRARIVPGTNCSGRWSLPESKSMECSYVIRSY